MNLLNCWTVKFNEYWTFTRHCAAVADAAAKMIHASCRMKRDGPSSSAVVWNVGIYRRRLLVSSLIDAPTRPLVRQHETAVNYAVEVIAIGRSALFTAEVTR